MKKLSQRVRKRTGNPAKYAKNRLKEPKSTTKNYLPYGTIFPRLRDARVRAFESLTDEQKDSCKTELGVFDLDKVQYTLKITHEPGTKRPEGVKYDGSTAGGWYPEVTVTVPDNILTSETE